MFCSLGKVFKCTTAMVGSNFLKRRMGINEAGLIEYDIYGEPVNLSGQVNYLETTLKAIIERKVESNDDQSNIGGRGDNKRELIKIVCPIDMDILEGDLISYPIGSNDWFEVKTIAFSGNINKTVNAYLEVRSSK